MSDHHIVTFDGGADHLLPGRWLAYLYGDYTIEGAGLTEVDAVADLKAKLKEKWPTIAWYQNLSYRQYPLS